MRIDSHPKPGLAVVEWSNDFIDFSVIAIRRSAYSSFSRGFIFVRCLSLAASKGRINEVTGQASAVVLWPNQVPLFITIDPTRDIFPPPEALYFAV
jgi:hypothetical protein